MKLEFKKGDKVEYLDSEGKWHPGKVTGSAEDGTFGDDDGPSPYQVNDFWFKGKRGVRARQPERKFAVGQKVKTKVPSLPGLDNRFGRIERIDLTEKFQYTVRLGVQEYVFQEEEIEHASIYDGITQSETFGEKATEDVVNHPSHYTSDPSGVECITITRHRNFNIGNAIKYLWRNGLKDSVGKSTRDKQIEDLKKAAFYINDEIKRLEELDG